MKRIPTRRVARVGWMFALALAGVAAPAWAEHAAARRIDEAMSGCTARECEHGIDIDFGGLSIRGAAMDPRMFGAFGRATATAEHIRVEPRLDGIHVHVQGLSASIDRQPSAAASAAATTPAGSTPIDAPSNPLGGIPIHLRTEGTVALEAASGVRVLVRDPSLEITSTGRVHARMAAEFSRDDVPFATSPRLELASTSLRAPEWTLDGTVGIGDHVPVPVHGRIGRRAAAVGMAAGNGVARALLRWGDDDRLTIEAERFDLGVAPTLPAVFEGGRIDLGQATLDGRIDLVRTSTGLSARIDGARISGIVVDAPAISKDPLYLHELGLDGTVDLQSDTLTTALTVRHGEMLTAVSGRIGSDDLEISLSLAPLPCQALLESMPHGFLPLLEGMQLAGEIDGAAAVRFAYADIARSDVGAQAEPDMETESLPGELELEFPFLENCEVLRDAPGIDLDALAGNYRHRFLSAEGSEQTRILAPGAQDYVTIAGAPTIARAFVLLEDTRFWFHDGFDRDQIERAFWHNLGAKGFSWGASTISQQTARNLWLGHERSLGRKLQEALLTARLERTVGKRRILEIYMNIIELGPEVHGVDEAAQYHFGVPPHELAWMEALHLASLAPAPVTYSRRFASGGVDARWRAQLEDQVDRLRRHGLLSAEGARRASRTPMRLRSHTRR